MTQLTNNVTLWIGDAMQCNEMFDEKVDLIYMDPPYNTKRKFTVDSKSNNTGFNDNCNHYEDWLNALIGEVKKTLKRTGVLVLHISSENSFIIEKVLRMHFKKIEKVFWKRCHGKNTVKNKFGAIIDILFIAYNGKRIFNLQKIPIEENSIWAFKNKDNRGFYSLGALKHDRTRKGHEYTIIHNGHEYTQPYGWKISREKVEKLIQENRIHFVPKSKNMYIKVYKHEHEGKPLSNMWDDIHSITRTSKDPRLYPTQKPQKLIERIVKIFTNENSIVFDPVCGAGTVGFVCDKLNRKCYMMDINPEVKKIIVQRFQDKIYNI